ncbi:MAG TPA: class I SAM-dependent methyltransferase [Acidimicrobiales bacterium]|nr:class I SAM-dependent methyltransferase [Acidimicrobiales bacterium]
MDVAGWDARYAKGQVWSSEANRFFVDTVRAYGLDRPAGGARAIDLGCGEGRNAIWLAMLGWSVTGVDMSVVGIDRGRAMAEANDVGINWIVADLETWDLGAGVWDLIAVVYVHWSTDKRLPFLQQVVDGLAPGGHVVVVGHDRTNIEHGHGGPQNPDVLTTPDELAIGFRAAGLEVLEAREVLRPVSLEPGHGSVALDSARTADAIDHVVVAQRPE